MPHSLWGKMKKQGFFGLVLEVANYRLVTLSAALLFLVVAVSGYWIVSSIVKHEGEELREVLGHTADVATHNLIQWNHHQQHIAKMWGNDPRLLTLVESHSTAHHHSSGEQPLPDKEHQPIIDLLSLTVVDEGYYGFMVITPDLQRIVSHRVKNGHGSVPESLIPYAERAFSGERFITPPIFVDDGNRFWPEDIWRDIPTQFIFSPIMDHQGRVTALLSFHYPPHQGWTPILSVARYNESAETYLVDRNGMMVSESRFLDQLKEIGAIPQERNSTVGVTVKPLSVDGGATPPLTYAAREVTKKRDGHHVTSSYRDYRGAEVAGTWRWIEELGVGLISEIDVEEGYRGALRLQETYWMAVVAVTLLGLVFIGYFYFKSEALENRERRQQLARHKAEQEREVARNKATHDPLTGLPNRILLTELGAQMLIRASRNGYPVCLLFMDMDGFKKINDLHGHTIGDKLLKVAAGRLKEVTRGSDVVCRWGGDEFVMLLDDCGSNEQVSTIADKVISVISKSYRINDLSLRVGLTVGICCYPVDGVNLGNLIRGADIAMYHAKSTNRGGHYFFHKELLKNLNELSDEMGLLVTDREHEFVKQPKMIHRIRQAIDNDTLILYWQEIRPLPATAPHSWVAAEVLVRMAGEEGVLAPRDFIPVAEQYGLMRDLDRWVCKATLRWMGEHRKQVEGMELISINISAESLSDKEFLADTTQWIERFKVNPKRLCFEISERFLMSNRIQSHQTIDILHGLGCLFALDDFGTGISSFSYLKQLPLDFVKIDGSFIEGMVHTKEDRMIVQSINEIAHQMNLKTIAEFVSSEETLQNVTQMGMDYGQGYLFSKPCPIGEGSGYESSSS